MQGFGSERFAWRTRSTRSGGSRIGFLLVILSRGRGGAEGLCYCGNGIAGFRGRGRFWGPRCTRGPRCQTGWSPKISGHVVIGRLASIRASIEGCRSWQQPRVEEAWHNFGLLGGVRM
jgi:hypothetical protein